MWNEDDWEGLFADWDQLNIIMEQNAVFLFSEDDPDEICGYYLPQGNSRSKLQAVYWLAKEMEMLAKADSLFGILERIEKGEVLYARYSKKKKDGTRREICVPCEELKKIQRRLNKKLFPFSFIRSKNASGFSGGGVIDAIRPHLNAKVILGVDCKDAFSTVKSHDLSRLFLGQKGYRSYYDNEGRRQEEIGNGLFSYYVANFLIKLVTYNGRLPQGPPTSPRLFDAAFLAVDQRLGKLAEHVGGVYTRYADNLFFSLTHKDCFDGALVRAILRIILGSRRPTPRFAYHKFRITKLGANAYRLLGLNVVDGKIHNTRDFKRRLRLGLHHVNWLLDQEMDVEEDWDKLNGMMSFAVKETLPVKLLAEYQRVKERISD
jgi:hypothetical protein